MGSSLLDKIDTGCGGRGFKESPSPLLERECCSPDSVPLFMAIWFRFSLLVFLDALVLWDPVLMSLARESVVERILGCDKK